LLNAMDELTAAGVTLAIVTNKFEHLAVKLIANLGFSARFATIIGGDTMGKGNGKPKPDPILEMIRRCQSSGSGPRAAFVGDSIHDVMAAKAAGIPCVAVGFGFLQQPGDELGADAVIAHYDELADTLRALAG
jgi:phosphoglycolate phosphatase